MDNLVVTLESDEARAIEENAQRDHLSRDETLKVCLQASHCDWSSSYCVFSC